MRHKTTAPIDEEYIFDLNIYKKKPHYLNTTKQSFIIGLHKAPADLKINNLKKFNLNVNHFTRN